MKTTTSFLVAGVVFAFVIVMASESSDAQTGTTFRKTKPTTLRMPSSGGTHPSTGMTPSMRRPNNPTTLRMPSTGTGVAGNYNKRNPSSSGGLRMPSTGATTVSKGYSNIRRQKPTTLRMPSSGGPSSDFLR